MDSPILNVLSNKYCMHCPLFGQQDHTKVRNQTIRINAGYFPRGEIELLLVAESPPMAFIDDPSSYFYAPGKIKRRGLAYHTMIALFQRELASKQEFLNRFSEKYYLLDMAKCPINKEKDRKKVALMCCSKYLCEELNALTPKRVLFVGKTSFGKIRESLDLKNLDYREQRDLASLPFGSSRNIADFTNKLRHAVKRAY